MPLSDEEKRRMRRLAEDLASIETDELLQGDRRLDLIRHANESRARKGIPPLEVPDPDAIPEIEFFERAKALGMVRRRR